MEEVVKFLKKVGTFLADRRLWAVGLLVALLALTQFFGIDAQSQQAVKDAFGETYGALQGMVEALIALTIAVGKLVAAVYAIVKLVESWTTRPPSGLNYAPK